MTDPGLGHCFEQAATQRFQILRRKRPQAIAEGIQR
jgi:hypothetical protein